MITSEEISKYYKSSEFVPVLPRYPQWRHFRVKDKDLVWHKIRKQIRTVEQLKRVIIENEGIDIYATSSMFLNPKNIGPKKRKTGYAVDCLVLGNDKELDFDPNKIDLSSMEETRLQAINTAWRVKPWPPDKIYFTGRGFRLEYYEPFYNYGKIEKDFAQDRLDFYEQKRKVFIKDIPNYNSLDKQITENPLCIVRVEGTVNSKTGYLCKEISWEELNLPISRLLEHIPFATRERPVIPLKQEDDDLLFRSITDEPERPGQSSLITYYLESTVKGVKGRHILLAKINKINENKIRYVQKTYNLSNVYIYKSEDELFAVCLTTMQWRRLQKIMHAIHSLNYTDTKYHMCKMPLRFDANGNHNMEQIKTINSDIKTEVSAGHSMFFNITSTDKKIGSASVIIGKAVKERLD